MRLSLRSLLAVASTVGLVACSNPLTAGDIVGHYQATSFTAIVGSSSFNLLGLGASVDLELKSDGTTTGRFVLPQITGFSLVSVDDDLAGTYSIRNNVMTLQQTADTYLAGFLFSASETDLRANQTFMRGDQPGSLRLVLTKQ